jgi:transposase
MTDKKPVDGQPVPRKKYTPVFKTEYVRQVAAEARQSDVARAQGIAPVLLGRWQRTALERTVPSRAERNEIKRDSLKKVVTIFAPPQPGVSTCLFSRKQLHGGWRTCAGSWA